MAAPLRKIPAATVLGRRIQALLAAREDKAERSTYWLGKQAGLSSSHLYAIYRGDYEPTFSTLRKIAPVLGVPLTELIIE